MTEFVTPPQVRTLELGSPEALRFAADVIEARAKGASCTGTELDEWPFAAHELRAVADHVEAERAKVAERHRLHDLITEHIAVDDNPALITLRLLSDPRISVRFNDATTAQCRATGCRQDAGHDGGCTA